MEKIINALLQQLKLLVLLVLNSKMENMVNKKGLSDIISTVLIILLVLAAIGILGSIALKQIKGAGSKIETSLGCRDVELTPVSCSNNPSVNPTSSKVLVSRGNDNVEMTSINLIFENSKGENSVISGTIIPMSNVFEPFPVPVALETKEYELLYSDYTQLNPASAPAKFSVAATIRSSDGKDVKCPASTSKVICRLA